MELIDSDFTSFILHREGARMGLWMRLRKSELCVIGSSPQGYVVEFAQRVLPFRVLLRVLVGSRHRSLNVDSIASQSSCVKNNAIPTGYWNDLSANLTLILVGLRVSSDNFAYSEYGIRVVMTVDKDFGDILESVVGEAFPSYEAKHRLEIRSALLKMREMFGRRSSLTDILDRGVVGRREAKSMERDFIIVVD
ncbi:hypothetical protein Tco_0004558 [Tanacetum coccineum]